MIEITHKQARYLIHLAADARLPEAQWNALQTHLEGCAECRAYRERLAGLERGLHRGLLARWRLSGGPAPGMVEVILAARAERRARLLQLTRLGMALLALLVMLAGAWSVRARARTSPPAAPLPAPSLSPTPSETFQGVVAYTTVQAGQRQIHLLNSSAGGLPVPESARLGQGGGEDIWPAWSPDGDWLAFLSNRSGSWQVYVMNVAGTRLTQLTAEADIFWRGPLSWSANGHWIALTGVRLRQENTSWIYLVQVGGPVDGMPGPRAVAETRGAPGFARFSPSQPLLAVQLPDGGLQVYNYEAELSVDVTAAERLSGLRSAPAGAFAWSFNGASLVYLAEGPYQPTDAGRPQAGAASQLVSSGVLGPYLLPQALERDRQVIDSRPGVGAFRSVGYLPGSGLAATLWDPHLSGCWTVRLASLFFSDQTPAVSLDGLCVESGLEQASWSMDRKWLVVAARPASPDGAPVGKAALYALRVPERPVTGPAVYQRLADLPPGLKFSEAGENQAAVRPNGSPLDIQPAAAQQPLEMAAPRRAAPPRDLPGDLLLTLPDGQNSAILRSRPDGKSRLELLPAEAANTCPVWSPDRSRIAFLSDRNDPNRTLTPEQRTGEGGRGLNEVYGMAAGGGGVRQLTFPIVPFPYNNASSTALPAYDCPVWSPDGSLIAAVARTGAASARLVFLAPESGLLRSVPIDPTSPLTAPVWTVDGSSLLLAKPAGRGGPASVVRITALGNSGAETIFPLMNGWDDVQGMTLSSDGRYLALVLVRYATAARPGVASLQIYNMATQAKMADVPLTGYDPAALTIPAHIDWEPNLWLTLAVPSGPFARHKAVIMRYIPFESTMHSVAFVEDTLFGWALREHWFVFSTESGLWGLADRDGFDPHPQPLLLFSSPSTWLDWR